MMENGRVVDMIPNDQLEANMVDGPAELKVPDSRIYTETRWVRVPVGAGGFFFPTAELGETVDRLHDLAIAMEPEDGVIWV